MNWMIYGANGFTGELISRAAVRQGLEPILAGRNETEIGALAAELGLKSAIFSLEDSSSAITALESCQLVLHCAGPFSKTSQPMIDACLESGTHYLDITGEISVFRDAHERADQARRSDIVLMPGVGFDIVPSDCLAATLVQALPAATQMVLALDMGGGPSPGTAKTGIEGMGNGGRIRRDGEMIEVPLAWKTRKIPFAHKERLAVTIPWGDVYTAYVSTGVPDIEVYMAMPPAMISNMRYMRWLQPALGLEVVQKFLKMMIDRRVKGPGREIREKSRSELWGEVSSADGRSVSATMTTPNGYDLTVTASLGIVRHLLANDEEGGYYTPSLLMGADYASTLPEVELSIL